MGKSDGNCIYLIDDPATIRKKVMKAVTDAGPTEPDSEKPEVIQNLFTLMEVVSPRDTYECFDAKWRDCSIRYGDMKKQLAEDIVAATEPIREKINAYLADTDNLARIARMGAEKARESASKTLDEVRHIIGFKPRF